MDRRTAERERLRAERDKLKAPDPRGLAEAWTMIEDLWRGTVVRAKELPEPVLSERVNGQWTKPAADADKPTVVDAAVPEGGK